MCVLSDSLRRVGGEAVSFTAEDLESQGIACSSKSKVFINSLLKLGWIELQMSNAGGFAYSLIKK